MKKLKMDQEFLRRRKIRLSKMPFSFIMLLVTLLTMASCINGSIILRRFSARLFPQFQKNELNCESQPDGSYPNPQDCHTFFMCRKGRAYPFMCPPPAQFNPDTKKCHWTASLGCPNSPPFNLISDFSKLIPSPQIPKENHHQYAEIGVGGQNSAFDTRPHIGRPNERLITDHQGHGHVVHQETTQFVPSHNANKFIPTNTHYQTPPSQKEINSPYSNSPQPSSHGTTLTQEQIDKLLQELLKKKITQVSGRDSHLDDNVEIERPSIVAKYEKDVQYVTVAPFVHQGPAPYITPVVFTTEIPYVPPSTYVTDAPYVPPATYPTDAPYVPPVTYATDVPYIPSATYATEAPYIPSVTYPTDAPYIPSATYPTDVPYIPPATYATDAPYVRPATYATDAPYIPSATYATDAPYVPPATYATDAPYVRPATYATDAPYISRATYLKDAPYISPATYATDAPYIPPAINLTDAPYVPRATYPTDAPYIYPATYATDAPYIPSAINLTDSPYVPRATYPTDAPYISPATYATDDPATYATDAPYISPATNVIGVPYVPPATYATDAPYIPPEINLTDSPYVPRATYPTDAPYIYPATYATDAPYIPSATYATDAPYITPASETLYTPIHNSDTSSGDTLQISLDDSYTPREALNREIEFPQADQHTQYSVPDIKTIEANSSYSSSVDPNTYVGPDTSYTATNKSYISPEAGYIDSADSLTPRDAVNGKSDAYIDQTYPYSPPENFNTDASNAAMNSENIYLAPDTTYDNKPTTSETDPLYVIPDTQYPALETSNIRTDVNYPVVATESTYTAPDSYIPPENSYVAPEEQFTPREAVDNQIDLPYVNEGTQYSPTVTVEDNSPATSTTYDDGSYRSPDALFTPREASDSEFNSPYNPQVLEAKNIESDIGYNSPIFENKDSATESSYALASDAADGYDASNSPKFTSDNNYVAEDSINTPRFASESTSATGSTYETTYSKQDTSSTVSDDDPYATITETKYPGSDPIETLLPRDASHNMESSSTYVAAAIDSTNMATGSPYIDIKNVQSDNTYVANVAHDDTYAREGATDIPYVPTDNSYSGPNDGITYPAEATDPDVLYVAPEPLYDANHVGEHSPAEILSPRDASHNSGIETVVGDGYDTSVAPVLHPNNPVVDSSYTPQVETQSTAYSDASEVPIPHHPDVSENTPNLHNQPDDTYSGGDITSAT